MARAARYQFRDGLRGLATTKRVARCGNAVASSEGVSLGVKVNPDGTRHAGFGGVSTCGSVWSCPVCAAKVATRRADELADVMRAVDDLGGSAFFVTLTMRHVRGDRLGLTRTQRRELARLTARVRHWRYLDKLREAGTLLEDGEDDPVARKADEDAYAALVVQRGCWDAGTDSWAAATSGGTWDKDMNRHGGLLGWAKVTETTTGANGWHVHVHALLCFGDDVPVEEVRPLVARMFDRWRAALERQGFSASGDLAADGSIPGWDVRRAQLGDGDLADYFTKMAHEVTSGHRKESRRPGGRTPLMLARAAKESYAVEDVARWWEWQDASEGRKQITWSTGRRSLRALAALGQEQTDEELAAEETEADERVGLSGETWAWLRGEGRVTEALDVAEDEGVPGLVAWLDVHGQTYVRGIGVGWVEQPEQAQGVTEDGEAHPLPLDRRQGTGKGWQLGRAAVLRERDPAGRPLRRPSDRPPRWTTDARAVLAGTTDHGGPTDG